MRYVHMSTYQQLTRVLTQNSQISLHFHFPSMREAFSNSNQQIWTTNLIAIAPKLRLLYHTTCMQQLVLSIIREVSQFSFSNNTHAPKQDRAQEHRAQFTLRTWQEQFEYPNLMDPQIAPLLHNPGSLFFFYLLFTTLVLIYTKKHFQA